MVRIKINTSLIAVLLGAVTLVAFCPVLWNDFVRYDDNQYVTANPHVLMGLTWDNLRWAFTSGYASNWHPITWLSHMVDVEFFGLTPGWHHLVNLLLHTANVVLLFLVLFRMTGAKWRSALVAALFAVHPLHVESVAWVAERKDVLSTFFFILMLGAYERYVKWEIQTQSFEDLETAPEASGIDSIDEAAPSESGSSTPLPGGEADDTPPEVRGLRIKTRNSQFELRGPELAAWFKHPPRWFYYAVALALFAFGLMSKPMLVTVPFLLLLLDFWPLGRWTGSSGSIAARSVRSRLLLEKVPFLCLAATSSVITFLVQRQGSSVSVALPLWPRVANAIASYLKYLGKTFWPAQLSVFYPHPDTRYPLSHQWPGWLIVGAGLLLAGISALVLLRRKQAPWGVTGWYWFLGTLVPVIGIVQVGSQGMADRYTYVPLIGVFIFLVWFADEICGRLQVSQMPRVAFSLLVLLAAVMMTQRQVSYWRNTLTLFQHALAVTGDSGVVHCTVGTVYGERGRYEQAIDEFRAAVKADPACGEAYFSLGIVYQYLGKTNEALGQYEAALAIRPASAVMHRQLGELLWNKGDKEGALKQYAAALRWNADDLETHRKAASALAGLGDLDEAVVQMREVVRLKPDDWDALNLLGGTLLKLGKLPEAQACYRDLMRRFPDLAETHINYGGILWRRGKREEALAEYAEAVRLQPNHAIAHYNLGFGLSAEGRFNEAALQFAEAARLKPDYVEAFTGLGRALLRQGKLDQASNAFFVALRLRPDAPAYYNLGLTRSAQGRAQEAVTNYEAAVRLQADYLPAVAELAWVLATDPKPEVRNGTEAVKLAERARELTSGKDPRILTTLDVAYAEAGRFAEASTTAELVRNLALTAGDKRVAESASERLALYQKHQPYRTGNPPQP